jgi:hypothetical protein
MLRSIRVVVLIGASVLTQSLLPACAEPYGSAAVQQDGAAAREDNAQADASVADTAIPPSDGGPIDLPTDANIGAACLGANVDASVSLGTQKNFFEDRVVCIETTGLACDSGDKSEEKIVAPFMRLSSSANPILQPMYRCKADNDASFVYAGTSRSCKAQVILGYCAPVPLSGCGLDKALYVADRDSRQTLGFVAPDATNVAVGRVCYVGSAQ